MTDKKRTDDSGPEADEKPTVLAVDDEKRIVQAIDLWLGDGYRVLTAMSGPEALELLPGRVDVVLLDRHMPDMSGSAVLDRIREEGYDCQIAMVTAVDPDFDVVEMPFDHYLTKPVDGQKLRSVVDQLLRLNEYDRRLRELYTLNQKIVTLEKKKSRGQLADSNRYDALLEREAELQSAVDDLLGSVDHGEAEELFEFVDDE